MCSVGFSRCLNSTTASVVCGDGNIIDFSGGLGIRHRSIDCRVGRCDISRSGESGGIDRGGRIEGSPAYDGGGDCGAEDTIRPSSIVHRTPRTSTYHHIITHEGSVHPVSSLQDCHVSQQPWCPVVSPVSAGQQVLVTAPPLVIQHHGPADWVQQIPQSEQYWSLLPKQ